MLHAAQKISKCISFFFLGKFSYYGIARQVAENISERGIKKTYVCTIGNQVQIKLHDFFINFHD